MQWGILALTISRSILRLESTLKEFKDSADPGMPAVVDTLTALHDQLNAQVPPPLWCTPSDWPPDISMISRFAANVSWRERCVTPNYPNG